MNRLLFFALLTLVGAHAEMAADPRPFTNAPAAGDIAIDPKEGTIEPYSSFSITFPTEMVPAAAIDAKDGLSPIEVWPVVAGSFVWLTQSRGEWQLGNAPLMPGQNYRFRLREGLADADGKKLKTAGWGAEFFTKPLTVSVDYEERENLSVQPQVTLEFDFPMRVATLAGQIWFQNRATRERFPCEILLNRATGEIGDTIEDVAEESAPLEFRVRPLAALPVGAQIDLIVDAPEDNLSRKTLPFPRMVPLGTTRPLAVAWVAAKNDPTDKPHVEIKFSVPLSDEVLPKDAVTFDPAVAGLSYVHQGDFLRVNGDFDVTKRYRVEIAQSLMGDRGFSLAEASVWGATFRPKTSSLLFPQMSEFRQRSGLGLRFAFKHCRTSAVSWRLLQVPLPEIAALRTAAERPLTPLPKEWKVLGAGEFPAAESDAEETRILDWKPESGTLTGATLFEASTLDAEGRPLVNRAVILFNKDALTHKKSSVGTTLRLADMETAMPRAGVEVQAVTSDLMPLARATTDSEGTVTFAESDWMAASWVLAGGEVFSAETGPSFPATNTGTPARPKWVGGIFTDRPLYRPGEEVFFKGILREQSDNRLSIREGTDVTWQVVSDPGEIVADGKAKVNANGGWDATWTSPAEGRVGGFRVKAKVDSRDAGQAAIFQIEEYRNPAFSVVCEPLVAEEPGVAKIKITSRYFHGAPNVGSRVRWTAQWISDHDGEYMREEDENGFQRVDRWTDGVKAPIFDAEAEGEAVLGKDGTVEISCPQAFPDPGNRATSSVLWQADVTGPDGQTIIGGTEQTIVMNAVSLGVKNSEQLKFELNAQTRRPGDVLPKLVRAELFLVQTKSVKQRIAPNVYRYRNRDVFRRVADREVPADGPIEFAETVPGRYVLAISPLGNQPGMRISEEAFVAAPGEAELPIRTEESLKVEKVEPDKSGIVGTKAAFRILAPSAGVAWVTIETDRVLDQFTMPLAGNSSVIEIPMKPEYEPCARVAVYLLRPGKADALPAEMYGTAEFGLKRRDAVLDLGITTNKPEYRPREAVSGTVTVRADGKPVANSEVAIFVVDDSILALGNWSLPDLAKGFLTPNAFAVTTFAALTGFLEKFDEKSLTQKGFTVGGGGKDEFGNVEFARKTFRPLILWKPSVMTDAQGVASFECEAPDNLTRFRVIALGQTAQNQFGASDATFEVTKDLIIEPALPRFLREGDTVELRAVARQRIAAQESISMKCASSLSLKNPEPQQVAASKNTPVIARFLADVPADATTATIAFTAASGKLSDSVEMTLPVLSPTIVVTESTAGEWKSPSFDTAKSFLPAWTVGRYDTILSTSPFITRLVGLPAVLSYPHGCLEQQSARILVYTAMANVLDAVPITDDRNAKYRKVIERSLNEFERSLLPSGFLPYWPNDPVPNTFVTIQSAWAVLMAGASGYTVPDRLASDLPQALVEIVNRKTQITAPASLRALALYVLSQFENDADVTGAARELYLRRDALTDEGKALLAMALNWMEIMPVEQQKLLRELPKEPGAGKDFDPTTFSSTTRTQAVCALARLTLDPASRALANLPDTSAALSTQENLWLLLALDMQQQKAKPLGSKVKPEPTVVSKDKTAAAWDGADLAKPLNLSGLPEASHYVLTAQRSLTPAEQVVVKRGMALDRVVRNLTDASRMGTAEAPFRLGDEILISYRMASDKTQSFVALEDPLPAGLEVINPNLAMFGALYPTSGTDGIAPADLSHSELRDDKTLLYFDSLPSGLSSYGVLARATSVGRFAWPSAQFSPMYDARFTGRTAASACTVAE